MMWLFNRMKTNIKDMQATFKNISQSTVEQNIKTTGLFKKKKKEKGLALLISVWKKKTQCEMFSLFSVLNPLIVQEFSFWLNLICDD